MDERRIANTPAVTCQTTSFFFGGGGGGRVYPKQTTTPTRSSVNKSLMDASLSLSADDTNLFTKASFEIWSPAVVIIRAHSTTSRFGTYIYIKQVQWILAKHKTVIPSEIVHRKIRIVEQGNRCQTVDDDMNEPFGPNRRITMMTTTPATIELQGTMPT